MKKLANLKGAKALNKKQQQTLHGGGPRTCTIDSDCSDLGECFICTKHHFCFSPFNSNC